MEMQCGEIFALTNADDISIAFGTLDTSITDSDWLKSFIAASP